MKLKNTITDNIFDTSAEEGKKLLEDYDCFKVIEADAEEKKVLKQRKKTVLTVKDKVLSTKSKKVAKNEKE